MNISRNGMQECLASSWSCLWYRVGWGGRRGLPKNLGPGHFPPDLVLATFIPHPPYAGKNETVIEAAPRDGAAEFQKHRHGFWDFIWSLPLFHGRLPAPTARGVSSGVSETRGRGNPSNPCIRKPPTSNLTRPGTALARADSQFMSCQACPGAAQRSFQLMSI